MVFIFLVTSLLLIIWLLINIHRTFNSILHYKILHGRYISAIFFALIYLLLYLFLIPLYRFLNNKTLDLNKVVHWFGRLLLDTDLEDLLLLLLSFIVFFLFLTLILKILKRSVKKVYFLFYQWKGHTKFVTIGRNWKSKYSKFKYKGSVYSFKYQLLEMIRNMGWSIFFRRVFFFGLFCEMVLNHFIIKYFLNFLPLFIVLSQILSALDYITTSPRGYFNDPLISSVYYRFDDPDYEYTEIVNDLDYLGYPRQVQDEILKSPYSYFLIDLRDSKERIYTHVLTRDLSPEEMLRRKQILDSFGVRYPNEVFAEKGIPF